MFLLPPISAGQRAIDFELLTASHAIDVSPRISVSVVKNKVLPSEKVVLLTKLVVVPAVFQKTPT